MIGNLSQHDTSSAKHRGECFHYSDIKSLQKHINFVPQVLQGTAKGQLGMFAANMLISMAQIAFPDEKKNVLIHRL